MRMLKALGVIILSIVFTPSSFADLVCTSNWMAITVGMVPGHPFTADAEIIDSHASAEGEPMKPFHVFPVRIARNQAGDVIIQTLTGHSADPSNHRSDHWNVTLCNLQSHKTTFFFIGAGGGPVTSITDGIPGIMRAPKDPFDQPFSAPHDIFVRLGSRDFDGVSANGYRWSLSEGKTTVEQWLSPEIFLEMLRIRAEPMDRSEERTVVKNLHRGEPDPALFQVPGTAVNP